MYAVDVTAAEVEALHEAAVSRTEAMSRAMRRVEPDAILRAIQAGMTGQSVGQAFGISRERVRQIVTRELGHGVDRRKRGRWCAVCQSRVATKLGHHLDPRHQHALEARRIARFWSRVDKKSAGGCWEWTASKHVAGYGHSNLHRLQGGGGYAHRVAYMLAKGPIPKGLSIDHLCRNVACVNPAHLEAVTPRENIMRSPLALAAKNARKTHCPQGHPYDEANTYQRGNGRSCRACRRASNGRSNRRLAEAA